MGDQFIIGYWRSEGVSLSPQEAVEQLQTNLLSADATLTYTTDESQFPSLDGTPLGSIWGPDVKVVEAIFSQGWGAGRQRRGDPGRGGEARRIDVLVWHDLRARRIRLDGQPAEYSA